MFLESTSNPRVKTWASLKTKKGRDNEGLFLVEGLRLVEEVLRSSLRVDALLWDVGTNELPDDLMEIAQERAVPSYELSPGAFAAVSDTTTSQGVIAVAERPAQDMHYPSHVLLLDGVQDPGNVGTLIRSADAFGIGSVVCHTGCADVYAPKTVRASMGGLFRIPTYQCNAIEYIQQWKQRWSEGSVWITRANAESVSHQANFTGPSILVIGSEAFGVSEEVSAEGTHSVRIPMNEEAESLNASIAGGILLYEMYRQQVAGNP